MILGVRLSARLYFSMCHRIESGGDRHLRTVFHVHMCLQVSKNVKVGTCHALIFPDRTTISSIFNGYGYSDFLMSLIVNPHRTRKSPCFSRQTNWNKGSREEPDTPCT